MAFDTQNQRLMQIQGPMPMLVPWTLASGFHAEDAALLLGTINRGADETIGGGGGSGSLLLTMLTRSDP